MSGWREVGLPREDFLEEIVVVVVVVVLTVLAEGSEII